MLRNDVKIEKRTSHWECLLEVTPPNVMLKQVQHDKKLKLWSVSL